MIPLPTAGRVPVVQHDADGRITATFLVPPADAAAMAAQPGYRVGNATCEGHFVGADGEIREKAPCPAVLTGLVLTALPDPCTLTIGLMAGGFRLLDGASTHTVTGGTAELAFDQPVPHWVLVESVPYLTARFEVEP